MLVQKLSVNYFSCDISSSMQQTIILTQIRLQAQLYFFNIYEKKRLDRLLPTARTKFTHKEEEIYWKSHSNFHTAEHTRWQPLPIFFFIIIFFFISLISSSVLIVLSFGSTFEPSFVQMSLVFVKVRRAMGFIGCLEKNGEPAWFGFLLVIWWIFSGGSVSMLLSYRENSIISLKFF